MTQLRRYIIKLFSFLFIHLIVLNLSAQIVNFPRLKFETIHSDQGHLVGSMTGMLKDSKGFIWFISVNGISRYDGYEFKVFRTDPEDHHTISPGKALGCTEDRNGNIWIACDIRWGLNSYNPSTGKFTRYSEDPFYKKNFPDGNVGMVFDKNNVLWMCMEGKGIYSWDQKSNVIKHYVHDPNDPSSLANNNTWDITLDASGNIYCCTPDNIELLNVTTGKFSHYPLPSKIENSNSHNSWSLSIYPDSKNNLWIITSEGLKSLNLLTRQLTEYKHDDKKNSIRGTHLYHVTGTPDGNIWIIGDSGLNIYDPGLKKFSFYQHVDNDPQSITWTAYGLHYDNSGVMWIQGPDFLNKLNLVPQKFHTTYVWPSCFFQDYEGKILIGRYYEGIDIFDPVTVRWTPFLPDKTAKELLMGRTLQTIFQDRDSVYWFGVDFNRLITFNPKNKSWKIYHYKEDHDPDSLGVGEILSPVYQDKEGKIWFAGNNGICNYEPVTKKFKNYLINYERGMDPINTVKTVFAPGDGKKWFGSEGLSYYDTQKDSIIHVLFHQNEAAKILSDSRISCTLNAGSLCMWIGTMGNGLFILDFKNGQCKRISTKDGLSSNQIYGITKDQQGNLWLTTDNCLSKYTPPSNLFDEKEKITIRNYNKSDGLPANLCLGTHPLLSKDGTLYFVTNGGTEGLVYFNPDSLLDNPFRPPVVITDFKLFNKSVSPLDSNSVLSSTIETTKEIKLNYKQNVISFTFAALSFIHPENNQYAYKLDDFDKDWIYTDATKRFANYTNLDPGDYTFEVKASNNDGVWNETPTILHLTITPPFWQTWWFRILMIAAVAGIVYGIYRYRVNEILRLQNIRNKISGDLHDDIGSTLNSISVYSEVAKQDASKHAQALEMIGEASRKIIDAMSDIVWTINPENDSFENIILRMRSLAYNLLRAKNIEFTFRADENLNDEKLSLEDRRNFFLIFKEAINNLVKYAEATRVSIQLLREGTLIKLLIRDNGKGFDPKQHAEGNGLNNMKRRSKEMKTQLQIESSPGNGTGIELILKS